MTLFRSSVEDWRAPVQAAAPDLPIDFLLSWIDVESGGNVCAIGACGDSGNNTVSCSSGNAAFNKETGLWQLYFNSPSATDALTGGATLSQLRAYCSGLSGSRTRDLSQDELDLQVISGINYVRSAMADADTQLAGVGATWDRSSTDYWKLVKLQHALPSIPKAYLPMFLAQNGRAPTGWDEFASIVPVPSGSLYDKAMSNANKVGEYASGFKWIGTVPTSYWAFILGIGGVIAIAWYNRRRKRLKS